MKDDLGKRMKENYEDRFRFTIPRRTYAIIRLDGKAFHTYTRNLKKPFDFALSEDIDNAVIELMKNISGAKFAYTQSDEISILMTDFDNLQSEMWFDGNVQKISSVSSSILTAEFNRNRIIRNLGYPDRWTKEEEFIYSYDPGHIESVINEPRAYFDSRVYVIPFRIEVMNYFIWRNKDCSRNSISMVAQSLYSHKELQGKSSEEKQEMIFQKSGINWADYPDDAKNGRIIIKNNKWHEVKCELGSTCDICLSYLDGSNRSVWKSIPAWKFTQNKELLLKMIPKQVDNLEQ